jgi:hypothetical protein
MPNLRFPSIGQGIGRCCGRHPAREQIGSANEMLLNAGEHSERLLLVTLARELTTAVSGKVLGATALDRYAS